MERETLLAMKNRAPATINHHSPILAFADRLLASGTKAIAVTVRHAEGSTPRDAQTFMIVSETDFSGTIGGGRLEWIALEKARMLLTQVPALSCTQTVSLGPEIGQCCGGRVELLFEPLTPFVSEKLIKQEEAAARPQVQIHGAGHTGKAIAKALGPLPFEVSLIDSRAAQLADMEPDAGTVLTALPEEQVREAAPQTAFILLTHSHDLDFLLAAEALSRKDAAYVGMIGSKTKRAVFNKWLEANNHDRELAKKLISPIGMSALSNPVRDKRPEVIAALVAAELLSLFSNRK